MERKYIRPPTKKYFLWLLEELDKLGIKWYSGDSLTNGIVVWEYYKSKTYVVLEGEKLLYGTVDYERYLAKDGEVWNIKYGDTEELRIKLTTNRL